MKSTLLLVYALLCLCASTEEVHVRVGFAVDQYYGEGMYSSDPHNVTWLPFSEANEIVEMALWLEPGNYSLGVLDNLGDGGVAYVAQNLNTSEILTQSSIFEYTYEEIMSYTISPDTEVAGSIPLCDVDSSDAHLMHFEFYTTGWTAGIRFTISREVSPGVLCFLFESPRYLDLALDRTAVVMDVPLGVWNLTVNNVGHADADVFADDELWALELLHLQVAAGESVSKTFVVGEYPSRHWLVAITAVCSSSAGTAADLPALGYMDVQRNSSVEVDAHYDSHPCLSSEETYTFAMEDGMWELLFSAHADTDGLLSISISVMDVDSGVVLFATYLDEVSTFKSNFPVGDVPGFYPAVVSLTCDSYFWESSWEILRATTTGWAPASDAIFTYTAPNETHVYEFMMSAGLWQLVRYDLYGDGSATGHLEVALPSGNQDFELVYETLRHSYEVLAIDIPATPVTLTLYCPEEGEQSTWNLERSKMSCLFSERMGFHDFYEVQIHQIFLGSGVWRVLRHDTYTDGGMYFRISLGETVIAEFEDVPFGLRTDEFQVSQDATYTVEVGTDAFFTETTWNLVNVNSVTYFTEDRRCEDYGVAYNTSTILVDGNWRFTRKDAMSSGGLGAHIVTDNGETLLQVDPYDFTEQSSSQFVVGALSDNVVPITLSLDRYGLGSGASWNLRHESGAWFDSYNITEFVLERPFWLEFGRWDLFLYNQTSDCYFDAVIVNRVSEEVLLEIPKQTFGKVVSGSFVVDPYELEECFTAEAVFAEPSCGDELILDGSPLLGFFVEVESPYYYKSWNLRDMFGNYYFESNRKFEKDQMTDEVFVHLPPGYWELRMWNAWDDGGMWATAFNPYDNTNVLSEVPSVERETIAPFTVEDDGEQRLAIIVDCPYERVDISVHVILIDDVTSFFEPGSVDAADTCEIVYSCGGDFEVIRKEVLIPDGSAIIFDNPTKSEISAHLQMPTFQYDLIQISAELMTLHEVIVVTPSTWACQPSLPCSFSATVPDTPSGGSEYYYYYYDYEEGKTYEGDIESEATDDESVTPPVPPRTSYPSLGTHAIGPPYSDGTTVSRRLQSSSEKMVSRKRRTQPGPTTMPSTEAKMVPGESRENSRSLSWTTLGRPVASDDKVLPHVSGETRGVLEAETTYNVEGNCESIFGDSDVYAGLFWIKEGEPQLLWEIECSPGSANGSFANFILPSGTSELLKLVVTGNVVVVHVTELVSYRIVMIYDGFGRVVNDPLVWMRQTNSEHETSRYLTVDVMDFESDLNDITIHLDRVGDSGDYEPILGDLSVATLGYTLPRREHVRCFDVWLDPGLYRIRSDGLNGRRVLLGDSLENAYIQVLADGTVSTQNGTAEFFLGWSDVNGTATHVRTTVVCCNCSFLLLRSSEVDGTFSPYVEYRFPFSASFVAPIPTAYYKIEVRHADVADTNHAMSVLVTNTVTEEALVYVRGREIDEVFGIGVVSVESSRIIESTLQCLDCDTVSFLLRSLDVDASQQPVIMLSVDMREQRQFYRRTDLVRIGRYEVFLKDYGGLAAAEMRTTSPGLEGVLFYADLEEDEDKESNTFVVPDITDVSVEAVVHVDAEYLPISYRFLYYDDLMFDFISLTDDFIYVQKAVDWNAVLFSNIWYLEWKSYSGTVPEGAISVTLTEDGSEIVFNREGSDGLQSFSVGQARAVVSGRVECPCDENYGQSLFIETYRCMDYPDLRPGDDCPTEWVFIYFVELYCTEPEILEVVDHGWYRLTRIDPLGKGCIGFSVQDDVTWYSVVAVPPHDFAYYDEHFFPLGDTSIPQAFEENGKRWVRIHLQGDYSSISQEYDLEEWESPPLVPSFSWRLRAVHNESIVESGSVALEHVVTVLHLLEETSWQVVLENTNDQFTVETSVAVVTITDVESGEILASFDAVGAEWTAATLDFLVGAPTTILHSVQHSQDDVQENLYSGSVKRSEPILELAKSFDADSRSSTAVGLRFSSVYVPQGAIIIDAFVEMQDSSIYGRGGTFSISAEKTSWSSMWRDYRGNIQSRQNTDANVLWTTENTHEQEYLRTVDISTVVQEVVNQTEWYMGNALSVIISGDGMYEIKSFEYSSNPIDASNSAARLFISYQDVSPAEYCGKLCQNLMQACSEDIPQIVVTHPGQASKADPPVHSECSLLNINQCVDLSVESLPPCTLPAAVALAIDTATESGTSIVEIILSVDLTPEVILHEPLVFDLASTNALIVVTTFEESRGDVSQKDASDLTSLLLTRPRIRGTGGHGLVIVDGGLAKFESVAFVGGFAEKGGAVYQTGAADVEYLDCVFFGSHALIDGAAIYGDPGTTSEIIACVFKYNGVYEASNGLGGIVTSEAVMFSASCVFSANAGTPLLFRDRGSVTNTLFEENNAVKGGGVAVASGSNVPTYACQFVRNVAQLGGAVYAEGIVRIPTNNELYENFAERGGAVYVSEGGQVEIDGVMIHDNSAHYGGAVYSSGKFKGTNLGFFNNTAVVNYLHFDWAAMGEGGAIYDTCDQAWCTTNLTSCTFEGNIAVANSLTNTLKVIEPMLLVEGTSSEDIPTSAYVQCDSNPCAREDGCIDLSERDGSVGIVCECRNMIECTPANLTTCPSGELAFPAEKRNVSELIDVNELLLLWSGCGEISWTVTSDGDWFEIPSEYRNDTRLQHTCEEGALQTDAPILVNANMSTLTSGTYEGAVHVLFTVTNPVTLREDFGSISRSIRMILEAVVYYNESSIDAINICPTSQVNSECVEAGLEGLNLNDNVFLEVVVSAKDVEGIRVSTEAAVFRVYLSIGDSNDGTLATVMDYDSQLELYVAVVRVPAEDFSLSVKLEDEDDENHIKNSPISFSVSCRGGTYFDEDSRTCVTPVDERTSETGQDSVVVMVGVASGGLTAAAAMLVWKYGKGMKNMLFKLLGEMLIISFSLFTEVVDIATDIFAWAAVLNDDNLKDFHLAYTALICVAISASLASVSTTGYALYHIIHSTKRMKTESNGDFDASVLVGGRGSVEHSMTSIAGHLPPEVASSPPASPVVSPMSHGRVSITDPTIALTAISMAHFKVKRALYRRYAKVAMLLFEDLPMLIINTLIEFKNDTLDDVDLNSRRAVRLAMALTCLLIGSKMVAIAGIPGLHKVLRELKAGKDACRATSMSQVGKKRSSATSSFRASVSGLWNSFVPRVFSSPSRAHRGKKDENGGPMRVGPSSDFVL
eukprot:Rmarinus@m.24379